MAERILTDNKEIREVQYELPNKHYIPVDMRYIGIDNLTPYVSYMIDTLIFIPKIYIYRSSAEVFCPVSHPR